MKVTREDLRQMAVGETKTFAVETAADMNTAASIAYQLQPLDDVKFSVARNYETMEITISKQKNYE